MILIYLAFLLFITIISNEIKALSQEIQTKIIYERTDPITRNILVDFQTTVTNENSSIPTPEMISGPYNLIVVDRNTTKCTPEICTLYLQAYTNETFGSETPLIDYRGEYTLQFPDGERQFTLTLNTIVPEIKTLGDFVIDIEMKVFRDKNFTKPIDLSNADGTSLVGSADRLYVKYSLPPLAENFGFALRFVKVCFFQDSTIDGVPESCTDDDPGVVTTYAWVNGSPTRIFKGYIDVGYDLSESDFESANVTGSSEYSISTKPLCYRPRKFLVETELFINTAREGKRTCFQIGCPGLINIPPLPIYTRGIGY